MKNKDSCNKSGSVVDVGVLHRDCTPIHLPTVHRGGALHLRLIQPVFLVVCLLRVVYCLDCGHLVAC